MDDNSTVVKPVYKSFKFKNSESIIKGLKAEKKTSLKDDNVFLSNSKSQGSEVVPNTHPDDGGNVHVARKASRASGYMAWKDSLDENGGIAQYTCTCSDTEGSKESKNNSTRKADMDLPELVAFLQESSNYKAFKDICIDREVPSPDKCLIENCELDHSNISCILDSDLDSDTESIGESLDSESSISTEHDYKEEVHEQCGFENLKIGSEESFTERDDLSIDHSTKKTISEQLLLVREVTLENQKGPSNAVLENSMVLSRTEAVDDSSCTSKASVKSDLENASNVSYHFGTSITTTNGREEVPQSAECHPPDLGNISTPDSSEDGTSDSLTGSSQMHQHCRGESGSSASEPPSSPLVYSGAITSFGSISLRSNSSTASSQSFAFPILSSEWNGSPVRMVNADQGQIRRHRHWRCGMRFLCCRF